VDRLALAAVAATLVVTACGGGGGSASPPPPTAASACDDPASQSVALVVDSAFASGARSELARLTTDMENDLHVCVRELDVDATTTAVQIRSQLKSWFISTGLQGALLIGDIPAVQLGDYPGLPDVVVTDSFYEVLDDAFWKDPDGNGIYNRAGDLEGEGPASILYDVDTPERTRNIWTGRLTPPRAWSSDIRVNQLRAYLNRNHAYRTGGMTYQSGMIFFDSVGHNGRADDREIDEATNNAEALTFYNSFGLFSVSPANGLSVVWNGDLVAQVAQWRELMQRPKEYAYITVHGDPENQEFSGLNYLTADDYRSTPPGTLLLDIDSCSNGAFTSANYLGGNALFSGQSLAIRAYTTEVLIVGQPVATPDRRLLAMGLTLGEIRKATGRPDISVLLGDPTLRMRRPGVGPSVSVTPSELDFPDAAASSPLPFAPRHVFTVTNTGTQPITFDMGYQSSTSWNGIGTLNRSKPAESPGYSQGIDPVFLVDPDDVARFPISLAPGEATDIGVYFVMDFANARTGKYRWKVTLTTDSPSVPVISVFATQILN
jgi:hypothetical protein